MLFTKICLFSLAFAATLVVPVTAQAQESSATSNQLMPGNAQSTQILTDEVPPGTFSQTELAPAQNSPQQAQADLHPATSQVAGDNTGSLQGITNRSMHVNWWLAIASLGLFAVLIGLVREHTLAVRGNYIKTADRSAG